MLAYAANGQKLKLLVIFKRKTILKGYFSKDVVVRANEKGWMNENIMLEWLKESFRKGKRAFFEPRSILIVDSIHSHLLDCVKAECKMSTRLAVISGGLTKVLQLLDVTVNRCFKSEIRKLWEDWMRSGIKKGHVYKQSILSTSLPLHFCLMHAFANSSKMKKAAYVEVVN